MEHDHLFTSTAVDPRCRVACETRVKTGVVIVAGEVTTNAWVDIEALVRRIGHATNEIAVSVSGRR